MYAEFGHFQFGNLDRNRLFGSGNADIGNNRSVFFFAFQYRLFRPSQFQDVIEDKHYQAYPCHNQRIDIQTLYDGNIGKGVVYHEEGRFTDEVLPSNGKKAGPTQEQRENSKILNPGSIRAFHAVFGGVDRVHNKTHYPNNGNHFKRRRDKTSTAASHRTSAVGQEYEHRIMQRVVLQKDIANDHDRRKLQKVADKRDQSAVRTLAFGHARFFVYVEYADFTAAETADKMHYKSKDEHYVCKRRQICLRTAKRVNDQMMDKDTSKRNGENIPQRFHCIDICIQTVNAAYLFLEQVFKVRERPQNVDEQYNQHQQINTCCCDLNVRPNCREVGTNHRGNCILHPDRGKIRRNQGKTRQCCQHDDGKEIGHPYHFRSETALVDTSTNKCTVFRRHRFDLVLFHLSKPPKVFTEFF